EGGLDGEAAEVRAGEPGQRTRQLADGGPGPRENHRTRHVHSREVGGAARPPPAVRRCYRPVARAAHSSAVIEYRTCRTRCGSVSGSTEWWSMSRSGRWVMPILSITRRLLAFCGTVKLMTSSRPSESKPTPSAARAASGA